MSRFLISMPASWASASAMEQVKQAIFQTQAFQTNGKFDNQRFSGIVAQMGDDHRSVRPGAA